MCIRHLQEPEVVSIKPLKKAHAHAPGSSDGTGVISKIKNLNRKPKCHFIHVKVYKACIQHCCVRCEAPRLLHEQPEKKLLRISNITAGRYIQARNSLIKIDNVDISTFNKYAK